MTVIIAQANNKGGVAKTKTTIHLARNFWRMGKIVTVIDSDGQANATDELLGTTYADRPRLNLATVLTGEIRLDSVLHGAPNTDEGLRIVPSDGVLDDVADDLVTKPLGVLRLKNAIDMASHLGDIVLIDCPPNVGLLTFSALIAADYVIIPTTPEPESLKGVDRVMSKIHEVDNALGRAPVALGTIATMVRDTVRHREGLKHLSCLGLPVLGSVPFRGGRNNQEQLDEIYAPIAAEVWRMVAGGS